MSTCKVVLRAPVGVIISGLWAMCKVSSLSLHHLHSLSVSSILGNVGISPKVLWKWLVAAMKWKSTCSIFGVVGNFLISMATPLMLFWSICLLGWCALQCRKRCSTVSLFCWHTGHVGESNFPMQYTCRCLASGVCPVLSCVRMLACFAFRFALWTWHGSDFNHLSVEMWIS